MNSSSSAKTYIRMQAQLIQDSECLCFLVEAIAKTSQNIPWETRVDGQKVIHPQIRRVSLDQFYELITHQKNAFFDLCHVLPNVIQDIMNSEAEFIMPKDTAYIELVELKDEILQHTSMTEQELSMILALYFLGFKDYIGFNHVFCE